MELIAPVWDCLTRSWDCFASHVAYVTNLTKILASLRTEMEDLNASREDLKVRLQVAEDQGMTMHSKKVTLWLGRVEAIELKVKETLDQGRDEQIDGKRHISNYKLGKKATKLLKVVKELTSKGEFQEVAHQRPLSVPYMKTGSFCEMPMENTVGIESTLEIVLDVLRNDNIGIIGLYGMGGVGKTTLLKKIHNELPKRDALEFDVAIWTVASKQATVEAVQLEILDKLHIPSHKWTDKPVHVKSALISKSLQGKKYILMLDDLWDSLGLTKVGLPKPNNQNKCKVVFTTRSEEVCGSMEAHQKFKIKCLPWDKAWTLFQEKVGEGTLNSHHKIPRLAKMVAEKCDGLPLALITIGRAMSSRKTPDEWSHALRVLRNYPSQFSGMGDHVLPILKFSYDSLPDPIIQACFVYCSIFPEDYEIPRTRLVDLWIGEGLLKEFNDISDARHHGSYIIESLKLACLLESGQCESRVMVHDVIRDMASWIASGYGQQRHKFLVHKRTQFIGARSSVHGWHEEVEKLSLWGCLTETTLSSYSPALSTLIISNSLIQKIPATLFGFIPSVKVLDMSGNSSLTWLPGEVSKLTNLEYLDLSRTGIEKLPRELCALVKLRHLLLNYMEKLINSPTQIFPGLKNLCVFRMNCGPTHSHKLLIELERLDQINETSIYLHSPEAVAKFLQSDKLQRCVRYLRVHADLCSLPSAKMQKLEALQICGMIEVPPVNRIDKYASVSTSGYFCSLRHLIIWRCNVLEDLNLLAYAPSLENLWVSRCESLLKLISLPKIAEMDSNTVFSRLKKLRLDDLRNLQFIFDEQLSFPHLERVYIQKCRELRQLPFKTCSTTSAFILMGEPAWWDCIQWTNPELEEHFFKYFQSWTMHSESLETRSGLKCIIKGDEWPEPSKNIDMIDLDIDELGTKNHLKLHLLRSSMNMWEE